MKVEEAATAQQLGWFRLHWGCTDTERGSSQWCSQRSWNEPSIHRQLISTAHPPLMTILPGEIISCLHLHAVHVRLSTFVCCERTRFGIERLKHSRTTHAVWLHLYCYSSSFTPHLSLPLSSPVYWHIYEMPFLFPYGNKFIICVIYLSPPTTFVSDCQRRLRSLPKGSVGRSNGSSGSNADCLPYCV